MLIVAPTRELAQQSQDVLEEAGKSCGIRSVSVYGGVSKDWQRKALNAKGTSPYEIVVATPGKNLLYIAKTLQIFLLLIYRTITLILNNFIIVFSKLNYR